MQCWLGSVWRWQWMCPRMHATLLIWFPLNQREVKCLDCAGKIVREIYKGDGILVVEQYLLGKRHAEGCFKDGISGAEVTEAELKFLSPGTSDPRIGWKLGTISALLLGDITTIFPVWAPSPASSSCHHFFSTNSELLLSLESSEFAVPSLQLLAHTESLTGHELSMHYFDYTYLEWWHKCDWVVFLVS